VSQDQAIAIWERASGLKADRDALHWWILFNCVKGQGIWVGSAAAFASGRQQGADHDLSGLVADQRPGPGHAAGDGPPMTPQVPAVLAELAGLLVKNAQPGVPEAERASDLGLSAMLLGVAAEIWDGQAHILVQENRAIRAILGKAGEDADLRLTVLQAENDRLRAALIAAQAEAEAAGDTARQDAIWAELAPRRTPQADLGAGLAPTSRSPAQTGAANPTRHGGNLRRRLENLRRR
jgi:hypothetical protein